MRDRITVPLLPLSDIIENYGSSEPIDFISIDVETKDFEVLQMLDLKKTRPFIICIEMSCSPEQLEEFLSVDDYILMSVTPDNRMYILNFTNPAWSERAKVRAPVAGADTLD